MEKFLRRPYLPGICEGAEVPHQCGPVGRKGMEELLKFFLDLQSASLHSGLSSFCPYSYAIPCAHMQIEETVTSRVGAYGPCPPRLAGRVGALRQAHHGMVRSLTAWRLCGAGRGAPAHGHGHAMSRMVTRCAGGVREEGKGGAVVTTPGWQSAQEARAAR